MAEHDPAAFELIFLSETAWCCLHWRQLCVYAWMCVCVCVRVEGVQSCRTHCSLLQSQSSYSVYVFVSAWWRRWVLLRPNESICIQGAFFLSHAGGSKRAATWEPVQRLVGAFAVFPKQTRKYKHRLALNSPCFFPLRRLRKLYNHTLSPPALYCTKLGSFLLFSEDWERGGEKKQRMVVYRELGLQYLELDLEESGSCWCPHLWVTRHPRQPRWRMDGGQEAGALRKGGRLALRVQSLG